MEDTHTTEFTAFPIGANEYKEAAWGITKQGNKHEPIWIPRGNVGPEDVKIELLYSGVCHTDCHFGHNDMKNTVYPFIGGHELCGKVTEVGDKVTKCKIGDVVGVGCTVDSCLDCPQCENGDEQYCLKGRTSTYNGKRVHGRVAGN